MDYTCPKCGAGWEIGENYYRGGTPFKCPNCKPPSTSTIPLYCPKCYPPTKVQKQFLNTPEGFLGGKTFSCPGPIKHTFTVPVTIGEVHSRLGLWGTEIGQYHQSDGIAALPQGNLKTIVSGGYCAGAALDWIRRALLGANLANLSPDNPKQLYKGAIAYSQQTVEKTKPFLKTESDKWNAAVKQRADAAVSEANAQLLEYNNKVQQYSAMLIGQAGMTQTEYNAKMATVNAALEAKRRQISAAMDERIKAIEEERTAWHSKSTIDKFWDEFASTMDGALLKLKENKANPVKRKFTDLTIVKSVSTKGFAGVGALIDALLRESQFQGNRAAYLGISPPLEGVSGHAIAILHENQADYYHLFDPNFGTYKLETNKLREAVVYIFKDAYPNVPTGNSSDNKAYEINGKVEGEYTIFEGMLKPVPTPARLLKSTPVTTSVAPQTLAPIATTKRPQPGSSVPVKGGSTPVTGQKPVVTTPTSPPKFQPGPAKGGGKVSDLISKFNK